MAKGDKLPVVMGREKAVPGGVATLGADGILAESQRPTLTAGDNITLKQEGSALEIGAVVPGKNLLHNAYLANKDAIINQKGKTEYTTAGYAIDRWYIEPGAKLEVLEDGVVFTPNPSTHNIFVQRVEKFKALIGKELTLSILIGETTNNPGVLWFFGGTADNFVFTPLNGNDKLYTVTMTPNSNIDSLCCGVQGKSNSGSVKIKAMKLELGPVQTLAHKEGDTWVLNDPPPDYALELAKCQRYYRKYPTTVGYFFYSDTISVPIDITDMRATPSVSCDKISAPNGTPMTIVSIGVDQFSFPQIQVAEHKTDLGTGVYIMGLTLDANL